MLDISLWVSGKLTAYSPLLTAMGGSADNIFHGWPDPYASDPVLSYFEYDNSAAEFADNVELGSRSILVLDIWSSDMSKIVSISKAVDDLLTGMKYARTQAIDLPDPEAKQNHRSLRYEAVLTSDDII